MPGVYWGLAGTVGTQGSERDQGHWGFPRGVGAIFGDQGVSVVYWGLAGTRYSGARRGIGGIGEHC